MGNWTKVLQHSMSRHNMTNLDKPKLVNYIYSYNRKICNTEVQNFGRENFAIQHAFVKIRQTFPPSKFYAIQYLIYFRHSQIILII